MFCSITALENVYFVIAVLVKVMFGDVEINVFVVYKLYMYDFTSKYGEFVIDVTLAYN